jgi:hypothetical protein
MRSLVLLALAACSPPSRANTDQAQPEAPKPVQLERPEVVQFQMRTQLSDLRAVESHLIAGKLEDAQASAFMLTKPSQDPGLTPWQPLTDRVVADAKELTTVKSIDDGCRRVARISEACAECHIKSQTTPVFPEAAPAPGDDGSDLSRIARHQWAVDRLWEGMVAGTDGPWVSGLEVLATSPMPVTTLPSAPGVASRLQQQANEAIASHREQTETLDTRTTMYGEMLITCSGCHRALEENAVSVRQ